MPLERTTRTRLVAAILLVTAVLGAACSSDADTSVADGDTSSSGQEGEVDEMAPAERRVVTLAGTDTEAPDEYDEVTVVQHGSPDASNVLVLAPGTSAGAGYFRLIAEEITTQLPDWQVWAVDRRENLLEDHSQVEEYRAGESTADEGFDYYLRWITDPSVAEHFEAPEDAEVAWARDWGMDVAVEDLAVVIDEASELGGKVVLGGHSLGGSITVAYATWDFDGRAGGEDLAGIALIDGGSSSQATTDPAEVEAELSELAGGSPWTDLVGIGLPWSAGVFNVLGSSVAIEEPDEPNLAYAWGPFPADLKPPVAPSNEGQYGYALDVDTSPENLALVHLTMGELAAEGDPRGFVDNETLPAQRAASMFTTEDGIDGTAWYHPRRLSIDAGTVNGGIANPAQDVVGVRSIHGEDLDLSVYALETGFGQGRVLAGAKALAEQSGITDGEYVEAHDVTHTDPMAIVPEANPLTQSLVPWLDAL